MTERGGPATVPSAAVAEGLRLWSECGSLGSPCSPGSPKPKGFGYSSPGYRRARNGYPVKILEANKVDTWGIWFIFTSGLFLGHLLKP